MNVQLQQQKLLDGQNQNGICSMTTPPTTTREELKRSANIREVENVGATKLASIAVNCGGTTVTDHLFRVGVLVRRNAKRYIDSCPNK